MHLPDARVYQFHHPGTWTGVAEAGRASRQILLATSMELYEGEAAGASPDRCEENRKLARSPDRGGTLTQGDRTR